jgi:hypothetical protein
MRRFANWSGISRSCWRSRRKLRSPVG